jgi:hypothetical protein
VVNPKSLADLDIVVAVRQATGYAPRHWKSNDKLANEQGSKTPCIMNSEAGYVEMCPACVSFADTSDQLSVALDRLTPYETRKNVSEYLLAPTLNDVTEQYKAWLQALRF